ncbi:MAG: hypothetical protein ACI83O_000691 [Patescibacteria group bacterium]|jgi:hypothetical protein
MQKYFFFPKKIPVLRCLCINSGDTATCKRIIKSFTYYNSMRDKIHIDKISPLIPQTGGGLSMEAHLVISKGQKYIVRLCDSEKKAKLYESISKKLQKEEILPIFIQRQDEKVFYEYLVGRDLNENESPKVFYEIGKICAIINNVKPPISHEINNIFNTQLKELTTGNYKKYTKEEYNEKKRRRPNERHDRRRIKAIITKKEKKKINSINLKLINSTGAKIAYDAFDVSPANFRLSKGKVYFVDIDAIKLKIRGLGIAKCLYRWTKSKAQKDALLKGYHSKSSNKNISEEYRNLLNLRYLIQALHDKAKLGREYKVQLKSLKDLINDLTSSNQYNKA